MRKTNYIEIQIDNVSHIIPAKEKEMFVAPDVMPKCLWCDGADLVSAITYTQYGFTSNKVTMVCGCPHCANASVLIYYVDKD
jgi:hypothetical protein